MRQANALAPGWLRETMDVAVREVEGTTFVTQRLRTDLREAFEKLSQSDRLKKATENCDQKAS